MQSTRDNNIMYGQYTVPPAQKCVKFGVGQPSTDMLPLSLIQNVGCDYFKSLSNKSVLQYGDIRGYNDYLVCLSEYLQSKYGVQVDPNSLFTTNGNTDALTLICYMFMHKNPLVIMEDPTYFLAKDMFERDCKFDVVSIPMEEDGININELENVLNNNSDRFILFYTIPTFHNPTSYTLSHNKRIKIGNLLDKMDNIVGIADEVYQLLYFNDEHKPPLPMCYYCDKMISLGSYSKILAPSLRLGWMQIRNKELMKIFTESGKFDSSGGNSPFVQSIVHGILQKHALDANIVQCRQFLKKNCEELSRLVKAELNEYVEFVKPYGGYFLWLKLKDVYEATNLVNLDNFCVQFLPGTRFSPNGNKFIRLSFSYYDEEGMKIGVNRLKELFEHEKRRIDLLDKIGIVGYNGRLGSEIVKILKSKSVNVIDLNTSSKSNINSCKCIIDVSSNEGTYYLVTHLIKNNLKIPLIVGTTGLSPLTEGEVVRYSEYAPVAYISNFSKGIPLLQTILHNIKCDGWDVSMSECHHIHKKDAPSGTALALRSYLNKDIPIESKREGDVFGIHTVKLSTDTEELTLSHTSHSRQLFAKGAVEYSEWIIKQKPGLYKGMNEQYNNIANRVVTTIPFWKYSGCGNDFVIVKSSDLDNYLSQLVRLDEDELVVHMCKRNTGIGADGLIKVHDTCNKEDPIVKWTYYNNDGKTVEMCGNGSRCVGKFAVDVGLVRSNKFKLQNNYGITQSVEIMPEMISNVSVEMPAVTNIDHNNCTLNVGVPHKVIHVNCETLEQFNSIDLNKIGKEENSIKPINVNIYTTIHGTIYVRTFEKGVNEETLACGSGCCAVAFVKYLDNGKYASSKYFDIIVKSGYLLTVKIEGEKIYLNGPVEKIFNGNMFCEILCEK